MEDEKMTIPVIALRGLTMLPQMTINFDIMRGKSIAAVEKAMLGDQKVFLVTQMEQEDMEPDMADLFQIGVVGFVKQLLKLPGGLIRVTVEGLSRAELLELDTEGEFYSGTVDVLPEAEDDLEPLEKEAMTRIVGEKLEEYGKYNPAMGKEFTASLMSAPDFAGLLTQIAVQFPWDYTAKQKILECGSLSLMYEVEMQLILTETEIYRLKREFQGKVKAAVDKNQREYILREQLRVLRQELGETPESDADEFLSRLKSLRADKEIKERIQKEIARFQSMPSGSQDANVLRMYLETVLELPWNKTTKDNMDMKHAKEVLEEDHYGLEKVKERVLEYLAVRILTRKGVSPILCLVGPPGTGKTSIARSIARAMGRKYVRISLGGVRDEAEIRGHRKTYVGAMPGRIVEGLKQAGVSNPLMLLDEVDKVGSDYKSDTSSALLEVLDAEQNVRFRDHYVELPIDLSRVLFIVTANTTETIPRPLLDRMEIIEVSSYTENEKFHIGRNYLIKKQMEKNGLSKERLTITNPALEKMIHNYTREAGVRNLERRIGDVCRKTARELLEKNRSSVRVTEKNLEKYLGREKILFENASDEDQVGIACGLAWTSVGGDTLQIEVNVMPGKGNLQLTGQMGDVMKESAQTALTYVRSVVSREYGVEEAYFETHDLHIHIPEGAVPKDGPSAGITMASAMLSAVTGRAVAARVAMTGEITLRGHVLMIGGLKEKLLAARMARIRKVLVPEKNRPDVEELPREITKGMEIVYVKEMDEVLREALVPGEEAEKRPGRKRKAAESS
ncbi:endopeptidase La [Otoolea muris]|uniref:endopeptidase La n=1 Tax=Otoolea muris TaxID=2941515 RepID=UPI00203C6BDB|nr:endopeptidase La [Otoolea muris]